MRFGCLKIVTLFGLEPGNHNGEMAALLILKSTHTFTGLASEWSSSYEISEDNAAREITSTALPNVEWRAVFCRSIGVDVGLVGKVKF